MYCTKCGAQLAEEAAFCHKCGKPVAGAAQEPAAGSQIEVSAGTAKDQAAVMGKVENQPGSTSHFGGKQDYGDKYEFHFTAAPANGVEVEHEAQARRRYLEQFCLKCQSLPLAELGSDPGADQDVTLGDVYIALNTTLRVPLTKEEAKKREQPGGQFVENDRLVTALEAAQQNPRLVLLGDPGAGKSTFVRNLLGLQAQALQRGQPLAGVEADLLPALVLLRDLSPRLEALDLQNLSSQERQAALAGAVLSQVQEDVARVYRAPDFAPAMQAAFLSGRCLLALDGLDEVPERVRLLVPQAARAVAKEYRLARILITCRVRSYGGDAALPGFAQFTLAPFEPDQVRAFCTAWYQTQLRLGKMDSPKAAEDKAADLSQAALSADLRELSDNPMMLTTMAIIHQRDVGLPKQRVRLYKLTVEVLVRRWQLGKTGERGISPDPALADLLKDDRRMRRILERLAYAAHLGGKGSKAAVDLTRGQAIEILEDPLYLGDAGLAARFLEYIDQRAGLLVGRGGESRRPTTYSFPHRTFQEYLAGCYLAGERDAARRLIEHAGEAETWNLAAELGAEELYYNGAARGENDVLDLAYDLWRSSRLDTPTKRRSALWAGKMVALVGRAAVERDMAKDGPAFLERVGPGLASLLGSDLTAAERADAGRLLGALGDPRFDPQRFHLPAEPLLGFVPIPAGPFLMGSNKDDRYSFDDERPQHEVTLPAYYLGRYPVTNAQFAQFASHGGYAVQRFWPEAQKAGRWKDGQYIDPDFYGGALRTAPFDYGQPFNLPNHPVVGASWYEALAYCRWLGEALKALSSQQLAQDGLNSHEQAFWQGLAEGSLVIGLPCEAEWEKAARGPLPSPGAVSGVRAYPWGDVFDPDKANCYETGLGATSAAGCFPLGASPYGLLDLSGNVWEWTRSLRGIIPTLPAWKSG